MKHLITISIAVIFMQGITCCVGPEGYVTRQTIGGAGLGAAIGAAVSGGPGAAVGAPIGAAAGFLEASTELGPYGYRGYPDCRYARPSLAYQPPYGYYGNYPPGYYRLPAAQYPGTYYYYYRRTITSYIYPDCAPRTYYYKYYRRYPRYDP